MLSNSLFYTEKQARYLDRRILHFMQDASLSIHIQVTNFLVEMTKLHAIWAEKCGDVCLKP